MTAIVLGLAAVASANPMPFLGRDNMPLVPRNITDPAGYIAARQNGCGQRPGNVSPYALCGKDFLDIDKHGWIPALEAAPMFNFAREGPNFGCCYPESAIDLAKGGPNPGTDPIIEPGRRCTDAGPYHGDWSAGNPFPVYVDWTHCPGSTPTWRINYNLYFVHDNGHKHDWEMVSVVWRKATNSDWWERHALIASFHKKEHLYQWSDLQTINNDGDHKTYTKGQNKKHPKVYVGMWHNAMHIDKKITCMGPGCADDVEYRSDDWWRVPGGSDMRVGSGGRGEIKDNFKYGGTTPPYGRKAQTCGWGVGNLPPVV